MNKIDRYVYWLIYQVECTENADIEWDAKFVYWSHLLDQSDDGTRPVKSDKI